MGRTKKPSFSLVELLIVVLIVGALAAIFIPKMMGSSNSAKINICKNNIKIIDNQIELYHINTGSWPTLLKDVTENIDYFPDDPPECPFDEEYIMEKDTHRIKTDKHNH